MDKMKLIKGAANILTGAGVAKTVDCVIQNNLPSGMKWYTRALTFIGTSVISSFVSSKMSDYVEEQIDEVKKSFDDINKAVLSATVKIEKEETE